MDKDEKVLYIRISADLHEAISKLAKEDKRSLTNEAEFILDKYAKERLGDYDKQATAHEN